MGKRKDRYLIGADEDGFNVFGSEDGIEPMTIEQAKKMFDKLGPGRRVSMTIYELVPVKGARRATKK